MCIILKEQNRLYSWTVELSEETHPPQTKKEEERKKQMSNHRCVYCKEEKEYEGWQWVKVGSREFDVGMVLEKSRMGRKQNEKREWHSLQKEQHVQRISRVWKSNRKRIVARALWENRDVRKWGWRPMRSRLCCGCVGHN